MFRLLALTAVLCSGVYVQGFSSTLQERSSIYQPGSRTKRFSLQGSALREPAQPEEHQARIDRLSHWAVKTQATRPIIRNYSPKGIWLWQRWTGTVLKLVVKPVLNTLAIAFAIGFLADGALIQKCGALKTPWEYLVTLSTLVLSFFTSQAYSHWQKVYDCTRRIQGRIQDIVMLLVTGADRKAGEGEGYTDRAQKLLQACKRLLRVSHLLFWAATPTHASCTSSFENKDEEADEFSNYSSLLLTPEGIESLLKKGQLTRQEVDKLKATGLSPSQYPYVLLEWVYLYVAQGLRDGTLDSGASGLKENLSGKFTDLRGEYFSIDDYKAGRMPLAYVQFIQVLVDCLVLTAPFALYAELGSLAVPLTGLLTLFFKGLLELSKSFLDPFGAEGYPGQNIRTDVLVAELNYGIKYRWVKAAETLPPLDNGVSLLETYGTSEVTTKMEEKTSLNGTK